MQTNFGGERVGLAAALFALMAAACGGDHKTANGGPGGDAGLDGGAGTGGTSGSGGTSDSGGTSGSGGTGGSSGHGGDASIGDGASMEAGDAHSTADTGGIDGSHDATNDPSFDSDGDCIPDALEGSADSDSDGTPDYLDTDSDGDGMSDHTEDVNCNGVVDTCELDRTKTDTDGDGVSDLVEFGACAARTAAEQTSLGCQCDGSNPALSPLGRGDIVFVSPYMNDPVPTTSTAAFATTITQMDLVFSIDTTASMGGALTNLNNTLAGTIAPGARAAVSDLAIGVVDFKDFGDTYVVQYDHRIQTVSTSAGVTSVQSALNGLSASGGGDSPEAGWEALDAIANPNALVVAGFNLRFSLATTFPTTPTSGETQGSLYGAGFRSGSLPVVVTITDAEWHDAYGVATSGENGLNDYTSTYAGAPSRSATLGDINAIGGHVMSLAGVGTGVTGNPKARGLATAQATGTSVAPADFGQVGTRPAGCSVSQCCTGLNGAGEAPDASGMCPLSFSYDNTSGTGVGTSTVAGIAALTRGIPLDVHAELVDVSTNTTSQFINKLATNDSGVGQAAGCVVVPITQLADYFVDPIGTPGSDGTNDTFRSVHGVSVCFDVVPKMNTSVAATSNVQTFTAELRLASGPAGTDPVNLGDPRRVIVIVPPAP